MTTVKDLVTVGKREVLQQVLISVKARETFAHAQIQTTTDPELKQYLIGIANVSKFIAFDIEILMEGL